MPEVVKNASELSATLSEPEGKNDSVLEEVEGENGQTGNQLRTTPKNETVSTQGSPSASDGRVQRTWVIASTHPAFLQKLAEERTARADDPVGVDAVSLVVEGLVREANLQSNQVKKLIFKIIRCHRCFQGGDPGGVKRDLSLSLPRECVEWLNNVCERCNHSSLDKTMRILVEFHTHEALK
jgi:hypothetical protein